MTELTDDLMKQLHFISKASNQYMHQNKQRLTGQQRVLSILNLEDNLSQSYLQEVLDLRPSSLAELLKKLEDKGDITRSEAPDDKRIKRVSLTDQGRKAAQENASFKDADVTEKFFEGLSDVDQQQLKDNLEKISAGWDDEFKQQADSFVDPMDRFEAMQKMRDDIMAKYGDNFEDMSPEDMKAMRKEMKEKMSKMGIHHHGPMMGGMHHMRGCGPRGMGHADFRFGNMF
ncbi:MarR family transcriptional regulator [Companilactobacillus ginsenosidimutans]|uniref:MarR family transcriptional regulator n=1 Tax=Companilactobacillus ginsenosidimutans TaxID=1007676 RepID=UPI00069E66C2|nr:MarR family transcriptional regulator [Companilactobacillus ginsenosidimutans]